MTNSKTTFLLAGHGSRNREGNDEIERFAAVTKEDLIATAAAGHFCNFTHKVTGFYAFRNCLFAANSNKVCLFTVNACNKSNYIITFIFKIITH